MEPVIKLVCLFVLLTMVMYKKVNDCIFVKCVFSVHCTCVKPIVNVVATLLHINPFASWQSTKSLLSTAPNSLVQVGFGDSLTFPAGVWFNFETVRNWGYMVEKKCGWGRIIGSYCCGAGQPSITHAWWSMAIHCTDVRWWREPLLECMCFDSQFIMCYKEY